MRTIRGKNATLIVLFGKQYRVSYGYEIYHIPREHTLEIIQAIRKGERIKKYGLQYDLPGFFWAHYTR